MTPRRLGLAALALLGLLTLAGGSPVAAQGYRVRLDSRLQSVSWRGVESGTIPRAQAIPQPGGGFLTPDGYAALCGEGTCSFFAPGAELRGVPWVTQADLTVWGLGIAGLSARGNARWATDLGDSAIWPGTEPAVQLLEGYLEYARAGLNARAGRQLLLGRLGAYGLDGGRVLYHHRRSGLEAGGYAGWGLARGAMLPVTDPALNPLDDFQPRDRQVVAGLELGWNRNAVDARLEYRRELDPAVDYFVSERAAASVALRPHRRLGLAAGGEYDLAFGQVGSADLSLSWIDARYSVTGGVRRYRAFFDLWTIWGAFSPVAHHAWHLSGTVRPGSRLTLRARGQRFRFDDTETFTPAVTVEDRGWRFETGVTWSPARDWSVDAGYRTEFGPGASSRGFDGRVTWTVTDRLWLSAHGIRTKRPLELRYDDAELLGFGADVEFRPDDRWRLGLTAARYDEQRKRPDARALDWDQLRIAARITLLFGSNADRLPLPRAVPRGGRQ